jgi:hypothetical protein
VAALFAIDGDAAEAPLGYEAEIYISESWSFPRFRLSAIHQSQSRYYKSGRGDSVYASSARTARTSDAECLMFNGDFSRLRIKRSGALPEAGKKLTTGVIKREHVSSHDRFNVAPFLAAADMLDLLEHP